MVDEGQYHLDFSLSLKNSKRELTLSTLFELAKNGYNTGSLATIPSKRDMPPAALFYLTGLLRENGYQTVQTYQCDDNSLREIASHNPIAICLSSTMILSIPSLITFIDQIRKHLPDTFLIVGGVFVWKSYLFRDVEFSSSVMENNEGHLLFQPGTSGIKADAYVVAPHGKDALLQLLKELEKGSSADILNIPNLAIPEGDRFHFTKAVTEKVDYETDFTRWEFIDKMPEQIPFRTSVGCPYRCRYCDFYQLFPKIIFRSKESLKNELTIIKARMGDQPSIIHASDDNIFINQKRVDDVTEALAESGIQRWIGFMRAASINDTNIEQIRNSGLLISLLGIESGDPGQLERMNKKQNLQSVKQGIELLDNYGITALMTYVVGFPGETRDTINNTAEFLNNLNIGVASSSYLIFPLSISPFSDLAKPELRNKWNIRGMMDSWSHYTMNSKEAGNFGFELFKKAQNVSYHYTQERTFYNRELFTDPQRKELFRLRNKLTLEIIQKSPSEKIKNTFEEIANVMKLPVTNIPDEFLKEIHKSSLPISI